SLFHRPCSTCFHVLSLYLLLLFFFFFFFFFSMIPRPPISTLFPYTTLFRSFNFIYDIPVFRSSQSRLVKTALGGWQVSGIVTMRSEEHTSELQSLRHLVCRLLLEKKKKKINNKTEMYRNKKKDNVETVNVYM